MRTLSLPLCIRLLLRSCPSTHLLRQATSWPLRVSLCRPHLATSLPLDTPILHLRHRLHLSLSCRLHHPHKATCSLLLLLNRYSIVQASHMGKKCCLISLVLDRIDLSKGDCTLRNTLISFWDLSCLPLVFLCLYIIVSGPRSTVALLCDASQAWKAHAWRNRAKNRLTTTDCDVFRF